MNRPRIVNFNSGALSPGNKNALRNLAASEIFDFRIDDNGYFENYSDREVINRFIKETSRFGHLSEKLKFEGV